MLFFSSKRTLLWQTLQRNLKSAQNRCHSSRTQEPRLREQISQERNNFKRFLQDCYHRNQLDLGREQLISGPSVIRDRWCWNYLLQWRVQLAISQMRRLTAMFDDLQAMKSSGICPDEKTFSIMLRGCKMLARYNAIASAETTRKVWEELVAQKIGTNHVHLTQLWIIAQRLGYKGTVKYVAWKMGAFHQLSLAESDEHLMCPSELGIEDAVKVPAVAAVSELMRFRQARTIESLQHLWRKVPSPDHNALQVLLRTVANFGHHEAKDAALCLVAEVYGVENLSKKKPTNRFTFHHPELMINKRRMSGKLAAAILLCCHELEQLYKAYERFHIHWTERQYVTCCYLLIDMGQYADAVLAYRCIQFNPMNDRDERWLQYAMLQLHKDPRLWHETPGPESPFRKLAQSAGKGQMDLTEELRKPQIGDFSQVDMMKQIGYEVEPIEGSRRNLLRARTFQRYFKPKVLPYYRTIWNISRKIREACGSPENVQVWEHKLFGNTS